MRTFHFRRMNLRLLIALAIIAILATAAYGFADTNTFSSGAGHAGDGSGTISGYDVTNVAYTITNADPATLHTVDFDLNAGATTVKVSFDGGTTWANCSAGTDVNSWHCNVDSLSAAVSGVTSLRVVAVQ